MLCANALASGHLDFELFEAGPELGGVWVQGLAGPLTKNTHQNSPVSLQGVPGRPMASHGYMFPHWSHAARYIRDLAASLPSDSKVFLNTRVVSAEPLPSGWSLATSRGREQYDSIIVATGLNNTPKQAPSEFASFTGEMLHVAGYRDPSQLMGKRVLIVGGARPSTFDTAFDAAACAALTVISSRSPMLVLPTCWNGRPIEELQEELEPAELERVLAEMRSAAVALNKAWRLPQFVSTMEEAKKAFGSASDLFPALVRDGRVQVRGGVRAVRGREVLFADGSAAEFDVIVLCIGYAPNVGVMPPPWRTLTASSDLYLGIFDPLRDDLCFVGYLYGAATSHWRLFHEQARAVAFFLASRAGNPQRFASLVARKRQGTRSLPLAKHVSIVNKRGYFALLHEWQAGPCAR